MNDKNITILDKEVTIVEYKDQRVLTFSMIDRTHQRPNGTAKRNFNTNKKHFTEGVHYIFLPKTALDEIRTIGLKAAPNGVYLITERGYLLLAKSLHDDRAWKVQDSLIDNYFSAKAALENQATPETLTAPVKPESQIVTTITQMEPGKPTEVATYNGRVIIVPLDEYVEFNDAFMERLHEHYVTMGRYANTLFDKSVTPLSFMAERKSAVRG